MKTLKGYINIQYEFREPFDPQLGSETEDISLEAFYLKKLVEAAVHTAVHHLLVGELSITNLTKLTIDGKNVLPCEPMGESVQRVTPEQQEACAYESFLHNADM